MEYSNVGKWNERYKNLNPAAPEAYGDQITYEIAAQFLSDCVTIEDWGCGSGGFLKYRPDAIGVDGSDTVFAKKKFIDLRNYTSDPDGIHLRHVLEHDNGWKEILANALASAKKKLLITMFVVPTEGTTKVVAQGGATGVSDEVITLRISRKEFMDIIYGAKVKSVESQLLKTTSCYGTEEVFYITI